MGAIGVIDTAADAEPVLGWLDQLHVKAAPVVAGQDAEGLRRNAIIALSAGIKLAASILRVQTAEVGSPNAACDLANLST